MKKHLLYWLAAVTIISFGCQKELSFEGSNTPAEGSLGFDLTGDCLPKTVNGTYVAAVALVPATNTINVQVNVTKTGSYVVGTDTVNGYFFRATGTFTTLGANSVTLRGSGTPFVDGINNFVVSFDSTFCDIQVTVLPAGSGPASFTLVSGGTPTNCASAVVSGTYVQNAPVNATNYVDIMVNVASIGTYTITATGGGLTFTGTGSFTATGNQTVKLQASGTPTTVGTNTITFAAPFATCNFPVTVVAPITGTLGGAGGACTPVRVNGTYTLGIPLVAGNTVEVDITTSVVGPYSISTNTVAGISFSATGTSNGATQTITLLNNGGTPTASGPQMFTVTFGTSTCTFSITIGSGGSAFIADCSTAIPDGLYEVGTQLNCTNTVEIDVNVTALGPYNIVTTATNGMTFSASGTFTTLGVQTITLVGSGTPAGPTATYNIPMPGTTPCTFPIFVDVPLLPIGYQFTKTTAPSTIFRGQNDFSSLDPSPLPPGVIFTFEGSNSVGSDFFTFGLIDANGTIANGETYSTSAVTGNIAAFSYDLPFSTNCVDTYTADPSVSGVSMTFTVINHNVATRTVTGTFSGTAKNLANQTITIATGTFTGVY
jgi:hypothetical protein